MNLDWAGRMNDLLLYIENSKLHIYVNYISECLNLLSGPLDEQLLLEDALIRITRLAKHSSTMKTQTA
jgi:hypothetical protein